MSHRYNPDAPDGPGATGPLFITWAARRMLRDLIACGWTCAEPPDGAGDRRLLGWLIRASQSAAPAPAATATFHAAVERGRTAFSPERLAQLRAQEIWCCDERHGAIFLVVGAIRPEGDRRPVVAVTVRPDALPDGDRRSSCE